eukprot:7118126-Alexandrium_andersonii.AAC.1
MRPGLIWELCSSGDIVRGGAQSLPLGAERPLPQALGGRFSLALTRWLAASRWGSQRSAQ